MAVSIVSAQVEAATPISDCSSPLENGNLPRANLSFSELVSIARSHVAFSEYGMAESYAGLAAQKAVESRIGDEAILEGHLLYGECLLRAGKSDQANTQFSCCIDLLGKHAQSLLELLRTSTSGEEFFQSRCAGSLFTLLSVLTSNSTAINSLPGCLADIHFLGRIVRQYEEASRLGFTTPSIAALEIGLHQICGDLLGQDKLREFKWHKPREEKGGKLLNVLKPLPAGNREKELMKACLNLSEFLKGCRGAAGFAGKERQGLGLAQAVNAAREKILDPNSHRKFLESQFVGGNLKVAARTERKVKALG